MRGADWLCERNGTGAPIAVVGPPSSRGALPHHNTQWMEPHKAAIGAAGVRPTTLTHTPTTEVLFATHQRGWNIHARAHTTGFWLPHDELAASGTGCWTYSMTRPMSENLRMSDTLYTGPHGRRGAGPGGGPHINGGRTLDTSNSAHFMRAMAAKHVNTDTHPNDFICARRGGPHVLPQRGRASTRGQNPPHGP